ncbi:YvrJ family protein [Halobacillus amylolyticus]|uniref:YvrJ family protein n=1 Tax=Halobacillus amylolyticus TaxID=2932259 RepID=A0ABY4HL01_9BACI|nr:YvrJ family protein [Halobacillus amylolyticus]UOR14195.1 YvrJ family protein [Halobacillus amylolyticus]
MIGLEPNYWVALIGNLGFPIVVTFYLLMRLERNFNQLEQVVEELISEIRKNK